MKKGFLNVANPAQELMKAIAGKAGDVNYSGITQNQNVNCCCGGSCIGNCGCGCASCK